MKKLPFLFAALALLVLFYSPSAQAETYGSVPYENVGNRILVGSENGLQLVHYETGEILFTDTSLANANDMLQIDGSSVLVGTQDPLGRGFRLVTFEGFDTFTSENLAFGQGVGNVHSIARGSGDYVLMGSPNGAFRYNLASGEVMQYTFQVPSWVAASNSRVAIAVPDRGWLQGSLSLVDYTTNDYLVQLWGDYLSVAFEPLFGGYWYACLGGHTIEVRSANFDLVQTHQIPCSLIGSEARPAGFHFFSPAGNIVRKFAFNGQLSPEWVLDGNETARSVRPSRVGLLIGSDNGVAVGMSTGAIRSERLGSGPSQIGILLNLAPQVDAWVEGTLTQGGGLAFQLEASVTDDSQLGSVWCQWENSGPWITGELFSNPEILDPVFTPPGPGIFDIFLSCFDGYSNVEAPLQVQVYGVYLPTVIR